MDPDVFELRNRLRYTSEVVPANPLLMFLRVTKVQRDACRRVLRGLCTEQLAFLAEEIALYPTQVTECVAWVGHTILFAGSGLLLDGVEGAGAVEDVVVLIEVENGDGVRAGRQVVILIYVCTDVAAEFGAIIPDLNLADRH